MTGGTLRETLGPVAGLQYCGPDAKFMILLGNLHVTCNASILFLKTILKASKRPDGIMLMIYNIWRFLGPFISWEKISSLMINSWS